MDQIHHEMQLGHIGIMLKLECGGLHKETQSAYLLGREPCKAINSLTLLLEQYVPSDKAYLHRAHCVLQEIRLYEAK